MIALTNNTLVRDYDLRLKDRTLATFVISENFIGESVCTQLDLDDDATSLLPIGLKRTAPGMWLWLRARSLPRRRRYADNICRLYGCNTNATEMIIAASMGLSLEDAYWVVPHASTTRFEDVTPYLNSFSETVAQTALWGCANEPTQEISPELVTQGTLRKAWKIEPDGMRALYKGRSYEAEPGEPASEAIASLLAEAMGIAHVPYRVTTIDGEPFSICPNFTTLESSFVPYCSISGVRRGLNDPLTLAWMLGEDQLERLRSILVFDALVCNYDRNSGNYGFMRDNTTGQLTGVAPMFDNGRSLFPTIAQADEAAFEREARCRLSSINAWPFERLCATTMGPHQKEQLNRIAEGEWHMPDSFGQRGQALKAFLMKRARTLASLPMLNQRALHEGFKERARELVTNNEIQGWQDNRTIDARIW